MRILNYLLAVGACITAICLPGCSREEKPRVRTPEQVRAEIAKVEKDPKMPPNVKAMVLGLLKKELASAEKAAGTSR